MTTPSSCCWRGWDYARPRSPGIRLGDIDWRQGVLTVRGKGSALDELPVPADVGAAMADYVRHGRPRSSSRLLFVSVRAPFAGLSPESVGSVVQRACGQAGLDRFGPHRLRHAVACQLQRDGASLEEIGQLLRQRDPRTTARYATVDAAALDRPRPSLPGRSRAMSILREHGTAYLAMRRSLGYKLDGHGRLLMKFIGYLEDHGHGTVTTEAAMAWAAAPAGVTQALPEPAALGGAVLRPLPVRLRPGLPGPADRPDRAVAAPPGSVPVFPGGHLRAHPRRRHAGQPAAGGHLPGPGQPARGHRNAAGRGGRPGRG